MNAKDLATYQTNPLFKKIPIYIYEQIFDQDLSKLEMQILQRPRLKGLRNLKVSEELSSDDRKRLLIAVMLRFPKLDKSFVNRFGATKPCLEQTQLISCFVMLGRIDLIDEMPELTTEQQKDLFNKAIACNQVEAIEWLWQQFEGTYKDKSFLRKCFTDTCIYNAPQAADWILTHLDNIPDNSTRRWYPILGYSESTRHDQAKLIELFLSGSYGGLSAIVTPAYFAAWNGQLDMVEFVLDRLKEKNLYKGAFKEEHLLHIFYYALRGGHLSLIQKMYSELEAGQQQTVVDSLIDNDLIAIFENGQFDCLNWLYEQSSETLREKLLFMPICRETDAYISFINLEEEKILQSLKWLFAKATPEQKRTLLHWENLKLFDQALKRNMFEVASYLVISADTSTQQSFLEHQGYQVFSVACQNQNKELGLLLLSLPNSNGLLRFAVENIDMPGLMVVLLSFTETFVRTMSLSKNENGINDFGDRSDFCREALGKRGYWVLAVLTHAKSQENERDKAVEIKKAIQLLSKIPAIQEASTKFAAKQKLPKGTKRKHSFFLCQENEEICEYHGKKQAVVAAASANI